MAKKIGLAKILLLSTLSVAFVVIIILGALSIYDEYATFRKETGRMRTEYIESQKTMIKEETSQIIDYVEYTRSLRKGTEEQIQSEVLGWINEFRYGKNGYIFVNTFEGITLAHYKKENIGKNRIDLTDSNGVRINEELINESKKPDGGYVDYVGTIKPDTNEPAPKIGYAQSIDDWQWSIGTGVYVDDIDVIIAEKRAILQQGVRAQIKQIAVVLSIVIALAILFAILFSRKVKRESAIFASFFKEAVASNKQIDTSELSIQEFKIIGDYANSMLLAKDKVERARRNVEEELREHRDQLEVMVKERTSELQEKTREFEQAKNKSESLLASVGDGVFGVDKEQKIIYFNQRAEEISGYKKYEVIGKYYYDFLKFVKVKDKNENIEFIRKALKGEKSQMGNHTVLIRKDKREIPVADTAAPIKDHQGEIVGAIVVFRDATQERELDRARAELISFAGHQLKAPLTYIKGNIEMLKEGKIDAKTMELANEVDKSVKEMVKLIGDVLNISRIEQGEVKFKPEPTQLEEVVEDVIKESSSTAKKRKVKVEFTKPAQPLLELVVDPQYIHEVLKNVISNAIKYTKDTVTISIEKKDDNILFTCADNGIGIPRDEQSKIFTKFYVASNTAKMGVKGTGLGLSIAKALVERMNGKIWFESEEDKGTTFYVSLPLLY